MTTQGALNCSRHIIRIIRRHVSFTFWIWKQCFFLFYIQVFNLTTNWHFQIGGLLVCPFHFKSWWFTCNMKIIGHINKWMCLCTSCGDLKRLMMAHAICSEHPSFREGKNKWLGVDAVKRNNDILILMSLLWLKEAEMEKMRKTIKSWRMEIRVPEEVGECAEVSDE